MDLDTLDLITFILQFSLGIVFVASTLPKIRNPRAFADSTEAYEILPSTIARLFALAVIPLEGFLAFAFLSGWLVALASSLALVLLLAFLAAVSVNLWRGRRIACGCFGETSEPISGRSVTRILLLVSAVGWLIVYRILGSTPVPTLNTAVREGSFQELVAMLGLVAFTFLLAAWLLALSQVVRLLRPLAIAGIDSSVIEEDEEETPSA